MQREHNDWLQSYIEYAGFSEAPKRLHFWAGVSAIAGALRRKVWLDMAYFKWHVNQYIIFVAPPGIVSKSSTVGIAMNLLRQVPGIKFGPDVVTWPALVKRMAEGAETYELNGIHYPMCALTLESSEFGNLLNPQDREMVDIFVSLWDGKAGAFEKETKHSGSDSIINPWINMIACTTPSWIAGNFPEYMIGGGFTSRCIFVYADKKDKFVPYPGLVVPKDLVARGVALIRDLERISMLCGEYKLTPAAFEWGSIWYERHYKTRPAGMDDDQFSGYLARKQTHLHKVAMILCAARSDKLEVDVESLRVSNEMITDLEEDMAKVFAKIGRNELSIHAERLISYIRRRDRVPYMEAYRHVHLHIPSLRDFEDVLNGLIRSGFVEMQQVGNEMFLTAGSPGGLKLVPPALPSSQ